MTSPGFLPDPNGLRLLHLEAEPQCVTAVVATTAPETIHFRVLVMFLYPLM